MPRSLGPILGRVVAVIAILMLFGIVLKIILGILEPMLPAWLMLGLAAGWEFLYKIISPSVAPIMALGILCAIFWAATGLRR